MSHRMPIAERLPPHVSVHALRKDLPYIYQGSTPSCTAAALSMVLLYYKQHYGLKNCPRFLTIFEKIRSDRRFASYGRSIVLLKDVPKYATEDIGLRAAIFTGSLTDIKKFTDKDIPVIVHATMAEGGEHALVITNVDAHYVYYKNSRSGDFREHRHEIESFLKYWETKHQFVVVYPPEK